MAYYAHTASLSRLPETVAVVLPDRHLRARAGGGEARGRGGRQALFL